MKNCNVSKIEKLASPCTYQGGKQSVATEIVDYILSNTTNTKSTKFYDLCCGSGAITVELMNRGIASEQIVMCDKSSWGAFWKAIGQGTFDIDKFYVYSKAVPRDKAQIQKHIKELSQSDAYIDEEYKYILLQAAAFGGKQIWNVDGIWRNTSFRDYWQPTATSKRRSPVNPMQPMIDVIEKRIENLVDNCKGLTCYHTDVSEMLEVIANDVSDKIIYIDPPYTKVTGYYFTFDYVTFLKELLQVTKASIYVSEKESISEMAIKLRFSGAKGGISGNKKHKNEEWLNVIK